MLELKNISFGVSESQGKKEILKGISLTIEDDKFVVITGPNGGGKSTLAKIIMGIEKPDSGTILFDGKDITDMNVTDRANVSIADACAYLSEVGLCAKDYINREVNGSLSGGELKRIEIATVLARGTKLSVFDEPEAGIDLWSFQNLIRVFENMRETTKGSILIISHQERILEIADEIVVISGGSVLKHGTREEILPEILGTSSAQGGCEFYRRDN